MNVAFLNARTADAYEFSFGTQQINGTTAGQTHTGTQTAHLLVNDLFQAAFIGHAAFDTFRHQFVSGVIALEIAIRGAFGHRAKGAHPAVGFVRATLIEFDFTRGLFGTRQHGANHHRRRTGGDRFGDIAGETDTAVSDNRNTGPFQRFHRVGNSSDLRHTHAGDDTGSTDGARADAHFHRAAAGFRQRACACASGNVAADDLQVRIFRARFTDTLQNAF